MKPVVLVVGDALVPTGFARVTESIISRLSCRYSFHQLGINYGGDPHDMPWPIYPASLGGDVHGVKRIAGLVSKIRPDIVLIVNDIWVVGLYLESLSPLQPRPMIIGYMPVDAEPLFPEHVRRLQSLDHIVTYTNFGARSLAAAATELKTLDSSFVLPPVATIPHGVDSEVFRPLFPMDANLIESRRSVRRRLLPHAETIEDAFIVLNANRNQPRKRIDVTIAGFALFAADKPANVRLYLHMGVTDCGWDVRELARRYGIADRLMLTHSAASQPDLSLDKLNLVYNTCDVGLNTSESEGWGLPSFEHAAAGAAQIIPAHTGPREIWEDAAEMLVPTMQVTTPLALSTSQLIAPQTVAAALERLYRDPALLLSRSLAAFGRATEPRYRWDTVAQRFDGLLTELLATSTENAPSRTMGWMALPLAKSVSDEK